MAQILVVSLLFARSTKGTHRYDTHKPAEQKLLTCLYVNKEALPDPPPQRLKMTVEVE